jgi:hypothetical protein
MKIERIGPEEMSLAAFADKYDLTLYSVKEKTRQGLRFSAHFSFDVVSSHPAGKGKTEREAIADFADQVSCTNLFIRGVQTCVPLLTTEAQ